jgi:hypothetical protein
MLLVHASGIGLFFFGGLNMKDFWTMFVVFTIFVAPPLIFALRMIGDMLCDENGDLTLSSLPRFIGSFLLYFVTVPALLTLGWLPGVACLGLAILLGLASDWIKHRLPKPCDCSSCSRGHGHYASCDDCCCPRREQS